VYSDDRSFVELFVDVMYDPIALDCSVILSSDEAASRLIVDQESNFSFLSGLIYFVWLWECSRGHVRKKIKFHKIMQTTVGQKAFWSTSRDALFFAITHALFSVYPKGNIT